MVRGIAQIAVEPGRGGFAQALDEHLTTLTRPRFGQRRWTNAEFGAAVGGVSERAVRNWREGKNLPSENRARAIVYTLFPDDITAQEELWSTYTAACVTAPVNLENDANNRPLIAKNLTFQRIREKIEIIFHPSSNVHLLDRLYEPLRRADDCSNVLGISVPTRDRVLHGDTISENLLRTIVSNLQNSTDIGDKITFVLLSDQTGLDDFCLAINVDFEVADAIRLRFDHPFGAFFPRPNANRSVAARGAFLAVRGSYKFFRLAEDGDGNRGVVQGAIHVRSLVESEFGMEMCAVLTTPKLGEEGYFEYFGRLCLRDGASYWIFDQQNGYRQDYIMLITIPKTRDYRQQVGIFTSMGQSNAAIPIGSPVSMRKCQHADDPNAALHFLRSVPSFTLMTDLKDEAVKKDLGL